MKQAIIQPYLHSEEDGFYAMGARGRFRSSLKDAISSCRDIEFGDVLGVGKSENVSGMGFDPFLYICLWRFDWSDIIYAEGLEKEALQ